LLIITYTILKILKMRLSGRKSNYAFPKEGKALIYNSPSLNLTKLLQIMVTAEHGSLFTADEY